MKLVSIPYGRESLSKVKHLPQTPGVGKRKSRVSIPYGRESLSKACGLRNLTFIMISTSFQFPTDGKAYPKMMANERVNVTVYQTC